MLGIDDRVRRVKLDGSPTSVSLHLAEPILGRRHPVGISTGGAVAPLGYVGQVFGPPVLQLFFCAVAFDVLAQRAGISVAFRASHDLTLVWFLH